MKLVGADGEPMQSAADAARNVQGMAMGLVQGLNNMPKMRVHLDACHDHLKAHDIKPTGAQADTLSVLKLVADFQDRAAQVLEEARTRAAQGGSDQIAELRVEDVE
jgi:hypothetical protein